MNDQELREQPLLSDERIQLIRQKYQAGQGRPEDGDDGHFAIRAQGVEIGCEVSREIYEAERKSNRELLQVMVDALFKAEQYMTSTGDRIGPGCLCHCPVIDGHTGSCPIPPAMRLAASKGITPTHD